MLITNRRGVDAYTTQLELFLKGYARGFTRGLEMNKYDAKKFIEVLEAKASGHACPYCNGRGFTTTGNFAAIPINEDFDSIRLGPNIPAGMLVCTNCGHIEFFALGALGLLPNSEKEAGKDGK